MEIPFSSKRARVERMLFSLNLFALPEITKGLSWLGSPRMIVASQRAKLVKTLASPAMVSCPASSMYITSGENPSVTNTEPALLQVVNKTLVSRKSRMMLILRRRSNSFFACLDTLPFAKWYWSSFVRYWKDLSRCSTLGILPSLVRASISFSSSGSSASAAKIASVR